MHEPVKNKSNDRVDFLFFEMRVETRPLQVVDFLHTTRKTRICVSTLVADCFGTVLLLRTTAWKNTPHYC
jgi:hypothetical protein